MREVGVDQDRRGPRWLAGGGADGAGPQSDAAKVLCVDGGGIRGILPAMVLAEIEKRTEKPACDLFDLIAGTSTGGIIAMGLVLPGPDDRPAFKASDGVAIYADQGPKIFARGTRDILSSLGGVLSERYDADGLEEILDEVFGTTRLSQALTGVLVTAYELTRRETYMFSSREALEDPGRDVLMSQAVRATTAAPTFFEPALVVDPAGRTHVLIDGAVYANSPGMCAFAEVEQEQRGRDIVIASMGAGSQTDRFEYEEVRDWGAAQWALPLLSIVLDGAAQTSEHVLGELLGPDRYFRFQQELNDASDSLDNVKPANMAALIREGERLILDSGARLDQLCELLLQ